MGVRLSVDIVSGKGKREGRGGGGTSVSSTVLGSVERPVIGTLGPWSCSI